MLSYYQALMAYSFLTLRRHYARFLLPSTLLFIMLFFNHFLLLFVPIATGLMVRSAILALEPDRQWSKGYLFLRITSHWFQHIFDAICLLIALFAFIALFKFFHSDLPFETIYLIFAGIVFTLSLRLWPLAVSNFLTGHHAFNSEVIGFPGIRDQWSFWGVGALTVCRWTRLNRTALYTTVPAVLGIYLCILCLVPALLNWPFNFLWLAAGCFLIFPWVSVVLVIAGWLAILYAREEAPEFNLFELIGKLKIEIPKEHFAPQFFNASSLAKHLRREPAVVRKLIIAPKDMEKFRSRMMKDLPQIGKISCREQDATILIFKDLLSFREDQPPEIVVGFEGQNGVIILFAELISPLEKAFSAGLEKWRQWIPVGGI